MEDPKDDTKKLKEPADGPRCISKMLMNGIDRGSVIAMQVEATLQRSWRCGELEMVSAIDFPFVAYANPPEYGIQQAEIQICF